jgi:hypothetical protein
MAFTLANLSGPSTANSDAPRIYTYRTNDTEATAEGSNYFGDLAGDLNVGDMMFIHLDADGTDTMEITWVTANDGTTVTIQGLSNVAAS